MDAISREIELGAELLFFMFTLASWMLTIYNINFYYLLFHALKSNTSWLRKPLSSFPTVTIQLPIFNERYVAGRLISSACSLKYPKDRLEIQVLDDSNDDTSSIISTFVEHYRTKGYEIEHIHRPSRSGYKAGALQYGLKMAKGEYIAVFDADFVPESNFLLKALPNFGSDNVGLVQARWGHMNAGYSPLTKAQAISLDIHFMVEQMGRGKAGLFLNFNGTAGIWRKTCLVSVGGWRNLLAEDLDVSYRAQIRGWRCIFLYGLVCPAELPVQMNACKRQQARWAKGSMQVLLRLWQDLLTVPLPWRVRFQAFMHLSRHIVHPLLIIQFVLTPVLLASGYDLAPVGALFTSLIFGPAVYLYVLRRVYGVGWLGKIPDYFCLLLFGAGISVNNAVAWFGGMKKNAGEFLRTPKFGIVALGQNWKNKKYALPLSQMYVVAGELSLGIYGLLVASWILTTVSSGLLLLPHLTIITLGFFYVGITNIFHSLNVQITERPQTWIEQTAPQRS